MENEEIQYDEYLDEIGYLARKLDTEMTVLERMKITKSTMYKIVIAFGIYIGTMISFAFIL